MQFILIAIGTVVLAELTLFAAFWLVRWLWRRLRPARAGVAASRYWRRVGWAQLVLVPVAAFVVVPGGFGWFGTHRAGTRGDERAYVGPRFAADGTWELQSRESLEAEFGRRAPAPSEPFASEFAVRLQTADGLALRAFHVPPRSGRARCCVVLAHGLFRGALELEPVASMFRELGCAVLTVELRNHGCSEAARVTFGVDESLDVLAGADWFKLNPRYISRPIVLFGVSMGAAAVAAATTRLSELSGIVLDSPPESLVDSGHRMLGRSSGPRSRRPTFPQPFRSLLLTALDLWSGGGLSSAPTAHLAKLMPSRPVLVIGCGDDAWMPPDSVERLHAGLPTEPDLRRLWICEGARHGRAWVEDPDGYRAQLAAFVDLVAR